MSNTGVWQKALIYLGLWEEPEATQYDDLRAHEPEQRGGDEPDRGHSNVRPLRLAGGASSPPLRTAVVEVGSFDDCELIGRHHRDGDPVLFDLAAVDRDTARRVIDFVSGVTMATDGQLAKVASRAFLLTPEGVRVSDEERLRLEARGYRFADGA